MMPPPPASIAPQPPTARARLFDALDIVATGLFAMEGAAAAAHAGLDLRGILVVGFIVALAGALITFLLRMLAVIFDWQVPRLVP